MEFKTDFRSATDERDANLYAEFLALKAQGMPIGKINDYLMQKYKLYSASSVWQIRKRVERKLNKTA